ncbi:transcriptional regulator [Bosea sp. MMO-172]|uniref:transcriptional regulator n=1 Tax=Bosea sp. MMO-172 TaxID=3127885 RepID=UPI0030169388
MSRPVKAGPVERARRAWGEGIPVEVVALAEACRARSQHSVAQRLGYSDATISYVLSNRYHNGDLPKLFVTIRGALMGETVECPVLGEIARDQCLDNQGKPFSTANPARARLYRACRRCIHRQQKDVA